MIRWKNSSISDFVARLNNSIITCMYNVMRAALYVSCVCVSVCELALNVVISIILLSRDEKLTLCAM